MGVTTSQDTEYVDKEECKCGKASIEFEVVAEDRYIARLNNATAKRGKVEVEYQCNACGYVFSKADKAMMAKETVCGTFRLKSSPIGCNI